MMRKESGFSLIELLVVLAIVGVITVMTVSISRNAIQQNSNASGINQIIADIASIKQSAVKENRYFAMRFNATGTSYSIQRQTTIGNLANWTHVTTIQPLDGGIFFDTALLTTTWRGFAINPLGMVYSLTSTGISAGPESKNFNFISKKRNNSTEIIYSKNIQVYSNGGMKIAK
jgi:prepilin-type N-terminal cleavage/methylation domain-containing protein